MSSIKNDTQIIRVQAIFGAEPLMCNINVQKRIQAMGGGAVFGWKVRHDVYNDCWESHCVWQSPEGELEDVTPVFAGVEGDYAVIEWPDETEFAREDAAAFTERGLPNRYVPTRPGTEMAKGCEFMTIADRYLWHEDLERCRYWTGRANRATEKIGVRWFTPDTADIADVLRASLA